METRKVQVTGGSTFTVSLPKGWADDHGVEGGSTVAFYADDDTLVLSPTAEDAPTRVTLEVSRLEGDDLATALLTSYVSGFDVISIEADRISAEQRSVIRSTTQSLIGLEVLEETTDRVVVQDLLDSAELSIDNAVTRMRLIATAMLDDAVAALCENEDDLAHDVVGRDDEVDRLWFVVSRLFRESLRSPAASEELGLHREDCFEYHTAARQLERIADHAVKIGQLAIDLDDVPDPVCAALAELHAEASEIVDGAMDALFTDEGDRATALANEARGRIRTIDEHARTIDELLRELSSHEAQQLGLVVDSLSRSADYGGNIAESALQKAAPTP